jgi:hypothetical protein
MSEREAAEAMREGGVKTGEVLSFSEGILTINCSGHGSLDGSGQIAFHEDNLEWEEADKGYYRFQRLPRSELVAIRDFLKRVLKDKP